MNDHLILVGVGIFGVLIFLYLIYERKFTTNSDDSTGKIEIDVEGKWKEWNPVLYCKIESAQVVSGYDTYTYWLEFKDLSADVDSEMIAVNKFKLFTGSIKCTHCNSEIDGATYLCSGLSKFSFDISVEHPVYAGSVLIEGDKGGRIKNKSFAHNAKHITIYDALRPFRQGESINWVPIPYKKSKKQKYS